MNLKRSVKLTAEDLFFISESIGLNIPDEAEMTAAQRRTSRKITNAYLALNEQIERMRNEQG
jgi:hypothetical protein